MDTRNEVLDKIESYIDNAINFDLETYDRDILDQIYDLFQPVEPQEPKEDKYCQCYNEGWTKRDGIIICRNCLKPVKESIQPKCDNISQVEKQTAEEILDLQQYVTNLLYYAYDKGACWNGGTFIRATKLPEFDKWVEEHIELLKEYAQNQQPEISVTDFEKANRYYFDCWGRTGSSMTKTILAVNKEDAILLFKGKYPDSAFDPPYTDE